LFKRPQGANVAGVKRSEVVISIVASLVAVLAVDLFPVAALVILTVVLLVGIGNRVIVAVLVPAIACSLVLALLALATVRCDPAMQDCTLGGPTLALLGWLVFVMLVGAVATVRLVARSRRTA
jgi:hypothetical protein